MENFPNEVLLAILKYTYVPCTMSVCHLWRQVILDNKKKMNAVAVHKLELWTHETNGFVYYKVLHYDTDEWKTIFYSDLAAQVWMIRPEKFTIECILPARLTRSLQALPCWWKQDIEKLRIICIRSKKIDLPGIVAQFPNLFKLNIVCNNSEPVSASHIISLMKSIHSLKLEYTTPIKDPNLVKLIVEKSKANPDGMKALYLMRHTFTPAMVIYLLENVKISSYGRLLIFVNLTHEDFEEVSLWLYQHAKRVYGGGYSMPTLGPGHDMHNIQAYYRNSQIHIQMITPLP